MRMIKISKDIKETEARPRTRIKSVLEAFENIVELAKDSNLDDKFFDNASACIRYASRKLALSPMQTVLLALFVDRSEDNRILISEIASYAGCRTTKILRLSSEIDVLENKHYLRASRSRDRLSYRVPRAVLNALKENRSYVYTTEPVSDLQSFFDRFNDLMGEMNNNETTYEALLQQTGEYLSEIKDSYFARTLKKLVLDDEVRLLFIYMAHLFVENNDDRIGFGDLDNLYDDNKIPGWCKNELRGHTSELFDSNLIENVNEEGMARSDCFKLTEYAKSDVLSELKINIKAKSRESLIKFDSFPEKKLIYNPSEKSQITELASILSADRFCEIQSRLRNAGMRTGFCSLFYGSPGTGKTETVYQIARATGRDILRVDVDKIKSCWVGESEKNIKATFSRYRSYVKQSERAPILLFNEADAVLGIRQEGAQHAVDKMENSIQNIILQEMEQLEGIMIATTNLTQNLDKAFERRFLYKIEFERPSIEAKSRIWSSMIPSLDRKAAASLARQYDFSGGQIENIARKRTIELILHGKEPSLEQLNDYCRTEIICDGQNQPRCRIGF